MLVSLARRALRLSSLAIPVAALVFLALAPAPAKADVCTPYLTGLASPFPNLANGVPITQCTTDLVINANGTVTVVHNSTPYTNSGNALIGVINDSGNSVFDLYVTGFNSSSPGILNFNSPAAAANPAELLCATSLSPRLACGNALATSGDEGITSGGQIVYFTGIGPANGVNGNTGDVIFFNDLLPGQTAIFGTLQDVLAAAVSPVPVPEPGSFGVLATGLLGLALYRFRRRRMAARLKPQAS